MSLQVEAASRSCGGMRISAALASPQSIDDTFRAGSFCMNFVDATVQRVNRGQLQSRIETASDSGRLT
jgi:hypothetical protein